MTPTSRPGWTPTKAHCKERTYDLYTDAFRVHLLPHFGQKDIAEITREAVKQLAYGLLARERSRATVKGVLTPLSAMFNLAIEDGHLSGNPALRILKRSRHDEGEQHRHATFLTREEVTVVLERAKSISPRIIHSCCC